MKIQMHSKNEEDSDLKPRLNESVFRWKTIAAGSHTDELWTKPPPPSPGRATPTFPPCDPASPFPTLWRLAEALGLLVRGPAWSSSAS